jgi:hypothetical protein
MNLKNAIESLRIELRKFSTQKQSFADYKLTDGTVVRVDGDLVAGTAVYVVAALSLHPMANTSLRALVLSRPKEAKSLRSSLPKSQPPKSKPCLLLLKSLPKWPLR